MYCTVRMGCLGAYSYWCQWHATPLETWFIHPHLQGLGSEAWRKEDEGTLKPLVAFLPTVGTPPLQQEHLSSFLLSFKGLQDLVSHHPLRLCYLCELCSPSRALVEELLPPALMIASNV